MTSKGFDLSRPRAALQKLQDEADFVRSEPGMVLAAADPSTFQALISELEAWQARGDELVRLEAWSDFAQEVGGVGAYDYDIRTGELVWSRSVRALYGMDQWSEPSLDNWLAAVHPEDRDAVAETASRAIRDGHPVHQTYRVMRSDGQVRWIEDRGRVLRSVDGAPERVIGLNIDVTDLKQAHEQRELLMNELSHRMKNTIATVQAMARYTLKKGDVDPSVREAFDGRLMAMAHAHEILTQQSWRGADVAEIVDRVLEPQKSEVGRFRIQGVPAELTPQGALALSMALHELCTNAAKYGSLSRIEGSVRLSWTVDDSVHPGRLRLVWREQGGPPVTPPRRQGFGSRMIRQAFSFDPAADIDLRYDPEGLVCEIAATAGPSHRSHAERIDEAASELAALELDALTELMNVAVTRAAAPLAKLLRQQIVLNVPTVAVVSRAVAAAKLAGLFEAQMAVQQAFEGNVSGRGLLVMPAASANFIAQSMLQEHLASEPTHQLIEESLAEVGNIVLQTALSVLANMLETPLRIGLPMTLQGTTAELLGGASEGVVVLVHVDLATGAQEFRGYILLLLNLRAVGDLRNLIGDFIQRYVGSPAGAD